MTLNKEKLSLLRFVALCNGRERCGVHFHRDAASLIEDGYMTAGAHPRLTPLGERALVESLPQFKDHAVDITGGVESSEYVRRLRDGDNHDEDNA